MKLYYSLYIAASSYILTYPSFGLCCPTQSDRFFNALKGHGALCRLVILPFESHGYASRESILHVLWETDRWLHKHCVSNSTIEGKEIVGSEAVDSETNKVSASGGGEGEAEESSFGPRSLLW